MKVIVIERADGKVTVRTPIEPPSSGETETDYLARIAAKPARGRAVIMEHTDLPEDGILRAARRMNGDTIVLDLPAAKDIAQEHAPELSPQIQAAADANALRALLKANNKLRRP